MSTQSPLPQNDPLLIAFQQLKHTPEYRNAVNWTIKAENENHADGELWFAFAAGWSARMDYAREKKEALINVERVKATIPEIMFCVSCNEQLPKGHHIGDRDINGVWEPFCRECFDITMLCRRAELEGTDDDR